ncbi:ImmA/IrrE family metallo-endopeptidase [uncultured Clostridium sp.]|uniref:ImmA/IrrE family metallo-endopeptidase n=1 Tax=uncultured Clostridium sp. TaxID=59620 RepID=UPI0025D57346|nr:ImmA/IrrE family metallo-endopeptidase [uncultured Clostridium sp.]
MILNMTRIVDDYDLRAVMAHELGHAILHSSDFTFFLHDHTLYSRGKFEREANLFATDLLIDVDSLDKCLVQNYSIEQLALHFNVPIEYIKLKFNI